ncbi:MAG: hypothetical protein ABI120_01930, partial [Gemmatimonadaceae bacterium]
MTRFTITCQLARLRTSLAIVPMSLRRSHITVCLFFAVVAVPFTAAAQSQTYSLIPRPAVVDARRGQFNLLRSTSVRAPALFD